MHKRYERDRKLVREKLKEAKAKGPLACEVCAFDFEATYGELGAGYIEVHHVKPVHTLKPGSKVRLTDLVLLCANCHRMAHRRLGALPIQTPNNIFNRIE
ncbi:HNH endonuclease [Sphingomonas hankookensis]|uniref:HNH endonuclease n=1 Tax=Sphingomonas hankookensis TaxID=563996 RepID=UPI001E58E30F|nr:HNH endonuclease [Sphingomonas hankookensis]